MQEWFQEAGLNIQSHGESVHIKEDYVIATLADITNKFFALKTGKYLVIDILFSQKTVCL